MRLQRDLVFVRHAEAIGNTLSQDGRAALATPNHTYPLTDRGREQAVLAGKWLKENLSYPRLGYQFFHSTYVRTAETMKVILETTGWQGVTPQVDSRLDEKWDGIFHQLSASELRSRYLDQVRLKKLTGYYHYRAPGGQNCPDVEAQIRSFCGEHASVFDNQTLFIVGHGRWFLLMQKLLHDLTVEQFLALKEAGCPNCSIAVYRVSLDSKIRPKSIVPWAGTLGRVESDFA